MRPRACAAIILGNDILMVRHEHDGRTYWTLPGGGVEPGETPEAAEVRMLQEVAWLPLERVAGDCQVSRVLDVLRNGG